MSFIDLCLQTMKNFVEQYNLAADNINGFIDDMNSSISNNNNATMAMINALSGSKNAIQANIDIMNGFQTTWQTSKGYIKRVMDEVWPRYNPREQGSLYLSGRGPTYTGNYHSYVNNWNYEVVNISLVSAMQTVRVNISVMLKNYFEIEKIVYGSPKAGTNNLATLIDNFYKVT